MPKRELSAKRLEPILSECIHWHNGVAVLESIFCEAFSVLEVDSVSSVRRDRRFFETSWDECKGLAFAQQPLKRCLVSRRATLATGQLDQSMHERRPVECRGVAESEVAQVRCKEEHRPATAGTVST